LCRHLNCKKGLFASVLARLFQNIFGAAFFEKGAFCKRFGEAFSKYFWCRFFLKNGQKHR